MSGAYTRARLTFYRPTATTGLDPLRGRDIAATAFVWLHHLSGERAANVLGIFATDAFKCRFRPGPQFTAPVAVGWRAIDVMGRQYTVKSVVENAGLYDMLLERA